MHSWRGTIRKNNFNHKSRFSPSFSPSDFFKNYFLLELSRAIQLFGQYSDISDISRYGKLFLSKKSKKQ